MVKMFNFQKKPVFGIDIGSSQVKLAEVRYENGKPLVCAYGMADLQPHTITEHNVNNEEHVADVIRQLIIDSGIKTKNTAIAVPDTLVTHKHLVIENPIYDQIEDQILFEVEKSISYSADEINFDYDIIKKDESNDLLELLLVVSRKNIVQNRVDILKKAGLNATIVDIDSFALERLSRTCRSQFLNYGKDNVIALVDIGANSIKLTVFKDLSVIFTREEVFGGSRLTNDIQKKYSLNYEKAEQMKIKGDDVNGYNEKLLNPFMELAILQIKRALQYFSSMKEIGKVDQIVLTGGCANLLELRNKVAQRFDIPTINLDVFSDVGLSNDIDKIKIAKGTNSLAVSLGLALRRE